MCVCVCGCGEIMSQFKWVSLFWLETIGQKFHKTWYEYSIYELISKNSEFAGRRELFWFTMYVEWRNPAGIVLELNLMHLLKQFRVIKQIHNLYEIIATCCSCISYKISALLIIRIIATTAIFVIWLLLYRIDWWWRCWEWSSAYRSTVIKVEIW